MFIEVTVHEYMTKNICELRGEELYESRSLQL